ncbi:YadA-like family protein [Rhodanobacter sp. BL-MT-08]
MNRIYRLVWCRSRRVLVVASELASSHHGGGSSGAGKVDRRALGATRKLLLVALMAAGGLLFASGAAAQSTRDAKLDDLQSLIAKYDTSRASAAPVQTAVMNTSDVASNAANKVEASSLAPTASARPKPARRELATAQGPSASTEKLTASSTMAPPAAFAKTTAYNAPDVTPQSVRQTAVTSTSADPNQTDRASIVIADTADRKLDQSTGGQLAQQSSTAKISSGSAPVDSAPAMANPSQPLESTVSAQDSVALVESKPVSNPEPAAAAVAMPLISPSVPSMPAASTASTASTPIPKAPLVTAIAADAVDKSSPVASIPALSSAPLTDAATLPQKAPVTATAAADAADKASTVATSASLTGSSAAAALAPTSVAKTEAGPGVGTHPATASGSSGAVAFASESADRRLKHPTYAAATASLDAKSSDVTDDADAAQSVASTTGAGVSPLSFTPLNAIAAPTTTALLPTLDTNAALSGSITAAVPIFPTPSSSPTGLIVGNGGVVGTATQLLGPSTNSLFAGGNGYVTNGSLQVSNANFSQGYSVVNVLGIPTLTLDPVGTLLTSTSGALVGGTGVNSHLTLLGGVSSSSYIYNINNGTQSGVLGLLLPSQAPAFASTCLNALVVTVACYGINAAQDYQVLVGDGATANGSKEVVIGTNASHTLPPVNADTAFPGSGVNDPTNPTGVPTADYEARLGHSVVIGDSASGTANAQVILGAEATANAANSVALGYQSAANRGAVSNYTAFGLTALQQSAGEVSIGSPGQERQITNVAAGSSATDAVNVAQLEGVAADASNSVQYDNAGKTSITLAGTPSTDGGLTNGTTVTNLHQGALSATSTDAVNGAQLYATNNTVSNIYNTTSKFFQANSTGIGSSALGVDSIAAGPGAIATGNTSVALGSGAATGNDNAIAIGTGANASFANSIALGSGSVTTVGAQTGYTAYALTAPQTSSGEINVGNRQITGVAPGSAATDAVNVEQLQGVAADSVQYDGASKGSITLGGPVSTDGGVTGGTRITNVQQGALSATSTDAVNGAQLYATNNTVSNIYNTTSKFFQANSTGAGSDAAGTDAIAAGPGAVASGNASIALGSGAVTGSGNDNAIAIGTGANASFANSIALGSGSVTTVGAQANYNAFGLAAPQTSSGELNIGNRKITGVAPGELGTDAVNVEQLQGVATTAANSVQYDDPTKTSITLAGPVSTDGGVTGGTRITNVQQGALSATSTDAVNGAQLYATNNTVSNIYNTTSKFFQANSTGTGSDAAGTDAIAAGPGAVATGDGSIAVGSGSVTGAGNDNAIAIGTGANASFANSIALGAGSATTVGALTGYTAYGLTAPQNSAGELNIGNRQITGLAPGKANSDAVNVAQLAGVSADAANSVQYDNAARTSVTLAGIVSTDGGLTNGTTLTNLHQGVLSSTSTDAVNGSQLWHWTQDTANQYSNYSLYNDLTNNAGSKYYAVQSTLPGSVATGLNAAAAGPNANAAGTDSFAMGNGATAQGDYSLAVSDNTLATGANSIAVGSGATASFANSIALGAGSATIVGAQINYVAYGLTAPQTSAGELNIGNRQITGVAAGSAPNDAVNLAQLEAVTSGGGGGASNLAVLYDADASGNPTNTITLTGNGSGAPVTVTNVAAGAETASSTDAVNGSQLWHWTQDGSNMYSNYSLYNDITSLNQGGGGNSKYVQVNSTLGGAVAGGSNSVAIGPVASAGGTNSVAVGNGASAAADNSVALGAGSVANRDNTVSVGSPGSERQITNVAAGTSDTDAANVGQVNSGVQQAENWASSYTDQKFGALSSQIQQIGNRANAGVASAMAMAGLPQAYEPGKSMAAVAAGTFRSESSLAVGVSTISEGGRWVYKLTGSVDTRGDGGVAIGAGMQW